MEVQYAFIRTVPGLENAEIMRPGYAVEYDFCPPTQLAPTLETQRVPRLYFAGQINGTSGYEEAGAQGLIAGANAALKVLGKPPLTLTRADAYLGVLIDDLVTKGTLSLTGCSPAAPSIACWLRADNADQRLTPKGLAAGMCRFSERAKVFHVKHQALADGRARPGGRCRSSPSALAKRGVTINQDGVVRSAMDLLAYPDIDWSRLVDLVAGPRRRVAPQIAEQLVDRRPLRGLPRPPAPGHRRLSAGRGLGTPGRPGLFRGPSAGPQQRGPPKTPDPSGPPLLAQAARISGQSRQPALVSLLRYVRRRAA